MGDLTVREVYDSFTPVQKQVVEYLVTEALKSSVSRKPSDVVANFVNHYLAVETKKE
jgi:hypothetical protein